MDFLQTHHLDCPYCGESIQLVVDCSINNQDYIEDCQVCCRPINVFICIEDEHVHIQLKDENE
ncbi:MAG: CPXCG motif-containing cysteine-rich protein [Gammaproteobacteria bacterium]|nr:CPXCG motif-containing cysteine-rich protein [Gammaproteobacteria bacterium]MCW8987606.1 CPXCG motif-containing cysteine-rich protein [Gammaproteobacteria bacterium]MCW9032049.1 CPXCG motif-containing cysteine-rich protein [Gammaproteobacteria bacterium]